MHLENGDIPREAHPVADRPRPENADYPEHENNRDEHVVGVGDVLLSPPKKREKREKKSEIPESSCASSLQYKSPG